MRLSAPKAITWLIAVVLGGLGILGHFSKAAPLSTYSFWLAVVGFGLLVLATLLRDL
jgi:hypothetical protein